ATTAAPRSGRDDGAPYGLRELSARAPPRLSRGRSLVRSPRRGRVCRVPTPGGRLFEGGPARSTLLLSGPRRRSEFRAVEEKSGRRDLTGRPIFCGSKEAPSHVATRDGAVTPTSHSPTPLKTTRGEVVLSA